jgi:hypothetical protein
MMKNNSNNIKNNNNNNILIVIIILVWAVVAIGQVGFGFESGGSGQFDFLEEIRSESGRIGSIYMFYFFSSLIDFDCIESHLISDRIGSGQVEFGSGRVRSIF